MNSTLKRIRLRGHKLLACVLAASLALYLVPLTSARAFADEGATAAGAAQTADTQPEVGDQEGNGADSATDSENTGLDQTGEAGASDSVGGVGTGATDSQTGTDASNDVVDGQDVSQDTPAADVADADEDEDANVSESADADEDADDSVLADEDIQYTTSDITDEEIAEVLSVLDDDPIAADEGIAPLSLGSNGAVTTFSGDTMFETAVAEAKAAYPSGCSTAILAGPGDAWVDALSAAGLAGLLDCPILFTKANALHAATKQALKDLGVQNVVIVGGTVAISDAVIVELSGMHISLKTPRLGGADCYDTQMKIYEYGVTLGWNSDMAIVATGGHYGDALSISPIAFAKKAPIFLADNGNLRSPQKKALETAEKDGKFSSIVIAGGKAAVSERAEGFLGEIGKVTRLGGATQYETSTEIAKWAVKSQGFSWDNAAFTTGLMPYDALAGSVLQGKTNSVMLLVADGQDATIKEASANKASIARIRFFGGTSAISPSLRTRIVERCLSDKITYEHTGISLSKMAGLEKQAASLVNPDQYGYEDDAFYQYAVLNKGYSGKGTAAKLNSFIARYGSDGKLAGMGQAFVDAAQTYGVNEVYLLSHAILESGWGKSDLAMGYKYDGKTKVNGKTYPAGTYYNFFGIGAVDSGPLTGGRALAIINGWTTPEKAITGAAKWIASSSNKYLNNEFHQNTLYKMRWNYEQAASDGVVWKQYATSTTWAASIAGVMANFYLVNGIDKSKTGLTFLVPLYS